MSLKIFHPVGSMDTLVGMRVSELANLLEGPA
jgi:hypothetical protein